MTDAPEPHPFDADTAVEGQGDGRYGGEIHERWWVGRGPNGGYVGAIMLRAMQLEVPDRAPRSMTVHFLERPEVGPAEVRVTVERSGRSAAYLSARLVQGETTRAIALAVLSTDWTGPEFAVLEMPEIAPREELTELPSGPPIPEIFENYRVVPGIGEPIFTGGDVPRTGGWLRTSEPRELDAPLVFALMDAWFPTAFVLTEEPFPAPTLDLTVHFRAPLPVPGSGPEDFYVADFHTALGRDGFFEEDGELWTADGRLIAQSRQLALTFRAS